MRGEGQRESLDEVQQWGTSDTVDDVVLVHDYLLVMRGAERTFAAMAECWPRAPIATLLYDEAATGDCFRGHSVITSPLQRLRVRQRHFRALLPLFPYAAERLALPPAQAVVSSSSAFAHGVRPPEGTPHICYCYSPFRYVYHESLQAMRETPEPLRPVVAQMLARVRRWENRVAQRPTAFIAISRITQQRIQDFWERDATIVHPPVEVERFHIGEPEDFFLVACELVRHKCVDIALEAARLAGQRIEVVGDGPERGRLEAEYGSTATFHGRVSDERLEDLYARARAFVVPNVEDFGIAAVEAQAAGRPVLALNEGGPRETVIPSETGVLVPSGDVDAFAEAMRYERFESFDPARIRRNAERFARPHFQRKLMREVARVAELARPPADGELAAVA